MLTSLYIKNYALIDELNVSFNNGFTIITGETGAGKSILLGALSLILGKRADLSQLKNTSEKCIVEAEFDIANYNLKSLFKTEDLDYEPQTIIRREILPSGKSRAFVNDSPVNLTALQALSVHLIDIHSQHQTLELTDNAFQFQVIDALAKNEKPLETYKTELLEYKQLQKELSALKATQAEAIKEYDYNSFLLNELVEAQLISGELETLEQTYETLNNVEVLEESLSHANQLLSDEQIGALTTLRELTSKLQDISEISTAYNDVYQRVNSSLIELDDVFSEIERLQSDIDANPEQLTQVSDKLQTINTLFQKHNTNSVEALLEIQEQLTQTVSQTETIDADIEALELQIKTKETVLLDLAKTLHNNRNKAIPDLKLQLKNSLEGLGMPNADFKIELTTENQFFANGTDALQFLFSANKGTNFNELKKAASGGELSRIMLAIKSILSKYMQLPTIMFDEIDTGVSGEISNKMGDIMKQMSQTMQVFSITHLPQVAAKGDTHFRVYKEDTADKTITNLVKLSSEDRIVEVAQMLGGKDVSESALAHAKQLLN